MIHRQKYGYQEFNPYVDAFWRWWESDLHRTLKELRVTGGEPLMSADMWKLLDWFKNILVNRTQNLQLIQTCVPKLNLWTN